MLTVFNLTSCRMKTTQS